MKVNVNEVLDQLARGFNVAVDELYPILYKQAIVDGIFSSIWAIIFVALILSFGLMIKHIIKKQKESKVVYEENWEKYKKERRENGYDYYIPTPESKNRDWDWDEPRQVVILLVGGTIVIIGMFIIPFEIKNAITALVNTEYYMIENVLEKLK